MKHLSWPEKAFLSSFDVVVLRWFLLVTNFLCQCHGVVECLAKGLLVDTKHILSPFRQNISVGVGLGVDRKRFGKQGILRNSVVFDCWMVSPPKRTIGHAQHQKLNSSQAKLDLSFSTPFFLLWIKRSSLDFREESRDVVSPLAIWHGKQYLISKHV